jgi:cytochrome c553
MECKRTCAYAVALRPRLVCTVTPRTSCRFIAVLALCCATGFQAEAQVRDEPRAQACKACHGRDGISVAPDVPNLAGQKPEYLAMQLRAFRAGERKSELMSAVARQLADDDIKAVVMYWSAHPGAGGAAAEVAPVASGMRMPAAFPQGFREYRRTFDAESKTVAVNWANDAAWQAARDGKALPAGSAVIVVNHVAEADGQGGWRAGAVRSYSAMESREGWGQGVPDLLRNGDWHYGLFAADRSSRLGSLHPRCLACHQPRAADSFVFTLDDLRKAAAQ